MSLLQTADLVAYAAHYGQKDKAGRPYIEHPRTVASFVKSEEEKVIALLHDVLEDTFLTEADLRPVFGDRVTDALLLLTHDERDSYFAYIDKISKSRQASIVKLADLRHNSDLERLPVPTEKDRKRVEKYHKAAQILREAWDLQEETNTKE